MLSRSQLNIQKTIESKEKVLAHKVDSLSVILKDTLHLQRFSFEEDVTISGNAFYLYKDQQLIQWSTNKFAISNNLDTNILKKSFVQFKNGMFLCRSFTIGNYTLIGLSIVKYNFVYENIYLENSFASDFSVDRSMQLSLVNGDYPIYDTQKRFLFSLFSDEDKGNNDVTTTLFLISFFVSLFLIIWSISLYLFTLNPLFLLIFWPTVLLLLLVGRAFSFFYKVPALLYHSKLFSPIYYASSVWLPSFGDLLINSIVLLFAIIITKIIITHYFIFSNKANWFKILLSFFLIGVQAFLFLGLIFLLKSIVINSSISFNNDSIFNYTFLHYVSFVLIGLWLLMFVYLSYYFSRLSYRLLDKKYIFWLFLAIQMGLFTIVNKMYLDSFSASIAYFFIYYIIIGFLLFKQISITQGAAKIVLLLFFSLLITHSISNYYTLKEKDERLLLAEKLGTQHDPITEYRLDELSQLIKDDSKIDGYLSKLPKNESKLLDYIDKTYLNTFSAKYKISATLCKENQILRLQPDNFKIECSTFFNQKVANHGAPTKFANVWFMNYMPGQISYLFVIDFETDTELSYHLYIELDSKMYVNDIGYPDLLIDKKQKGVTKDFSKYTYARYVNNNLVSQFGKYSFSIKFDRYKELVSSSSFFDYDGYNHLYYSFNDKEKVLLSKKNASFFEKIANISFFFILYGFLLLLLTLAFINPEIFVKQKISFRFRMQLYMIVIILISFVLIGTVTIRYFLTLNNAKNIEFVNEKMHSILIEFENQLNQLNTTTEDNSSRVNQLVFTLSERYFVDINVYSPAGQLIATSRPQMFQQGLILDKMNSEAYNEFAKSQKTIYFHDEFIGKQKYWSIYMPYFTTDGSVAMYVNMPYFAKQKELNSEISSFVITFLSVYMFIIFITIIIALLLARFISRPLLLIKERMSKIQLGDKNEKIAWNSTDEIGSLVEVYNNMVDELRYSAELLAISHREQAWREMAQQVAHEIKNPLTPMKLSVQMLERTWRDGDPEWEQRLKQFTLTLVEQIDALSDIASSFSNFAKMPQADFSKEDLLSIIQSVVALHVYPNITIEVEVKEDCFYDVYVDKNQLIRVFNNLIKNAIQSIKANHKGTIRILVSDYDIQKWLVEVSDNGSGISDSVKDRIFSPNFTTKTSGMGLGLAMVKNIIVDFGGTIWFTSSVEKGTTFSFTLPKHT